MTDDISPSGRKHLRDRRPWPFGRSEIMAGLRRLSGDPSLVIEQIHDFEIPHQRPSIGQVRGIQVEAEGRAGEQTFHLVLKEPVGATRAGTAGVGLREVSVYRTLTDQLPLRLPHLVASHPAGEWLVIEHMSPKVLPSNWAAQHYQLAIQGLVSLHDRFWDLGSDLRVFNWLARPLDSDFKVYIQAATAGADQLARNPPPALLDWDASFPELIQRLVSSAGEIAGALKGAPATLIHGDYWPGNLVFDRNGRLVVYDWQQAGIGPCVLDLVHFVQSSRWWFAPIPLGIEEILKLYRENLARSNGHEWEDPQWEALWDYGLLWIFIANWVDLLAAIPESLIETRLQAIEEIWLDPLKAAAARRNIPEV